MPARHTSKPELSAQLLEAQQRLMELRQQRPPRPQLPRRLATRHESAEKGASWLIANAQKELRRLREQAGIKPAKPLKPVSPDWVSELGAPGKEPQQKPTKMSEIVTVYPSLLLAILKKDQAAAGRIYLLLRYLDMTGRGWLPVEEIRQHLTKKGSPLKVVGWRRLRQIFHQGEGIFWKRDRHGRLWLRSVPKIALELDCGRLKGKRVELPKNALLGGIGAVRAHFYASFHSSRNSDNPISRETLESITGLSPRTQREYDRAATVKRQRNIAVGQKHTKIIAEEQYWQRGGAVFSFVDSQGKQGPKNREYLAWHMPNSYQAPHQQRSNKGRQKKINQQLVSLVENGVQGNDQHGVDKLFWPDGAAAGKAYNHDRELDAYWRRGKAQRRPGAIWYVLAGEVQ